jgi:hypothetical protein
MKAVVVHKDASAVEKDWAKQYAGLDPAVKAQFLTGPADWDVRVQTAFTIPALTWNDIVKTVTDAAKAAGAGGVVILASGHGGSIDPDAGIINWDATEPPGQTKGLNFTKGPINKGLFWDERISRYTDRIPFGMPPLSRTRTRTSQRARRIYGRYGRSVLRRLTPSRG